MERDGGLDIRRGQMTEDDTAKTLGIAHETGRGAERALLGQLAANLLLLHLGGTLHALCQCLRGKTLVVNALDGARHKLQVLGGDERIGG